MDDAFLIPHIRQNALAAGAVSLHPLSSVNEYGYPETAMPIFVDPACSVWDENGIEQYGGGNQLPALRKLVQDMVQKAGRRQITDRWNMQKRKSTGATSLESFSVMKAEWREVVQEERRRSIKINSHTVEVIYAHTQPSAALDEKNAILNRSLATLNTVAEALVQAFTAKQGGHLCMREAYTGVVTRTTDEHIIVMYERKDRVDGEPVTQRYKRSHFIEDCVPQQGDTIEAHMIVAWVAASPARVAAEKARATAVSSTKLSDTQDDDKFADLAKYAWQGAIDW